MSRFGHASLLDLGGKGGFAEVRRTPQFLPHTRPLGSDGFLLRGVTCQPA